LIILIILREEYKLWSSSSSPTSCHFISYWSRYSLQHPDLKHPQSSSENRSAEENHAPVVLCPQNGLSWDWTRTSVV
jgi:hypothetical protein